jgi:murein DD-endopeptidase MepM/ murein hydrolase activator NlpD
MPVTVQPGDTLWAIAYRHLGDGQRWPELHALNRDQLPDPNQLAVGQVLRLPGDLPAAQTPGGQPRSEDVAAPAGGTSPAGGLVQTWGQARSAWEQVRRSWSEGWKALDASARALDERIRSAPESFRQQVESFLSALSSAKSDLVWSRAHVGHLSAAEQTELDRLSQRYNDLAAGFLSDVEGDARLSLGVAPVLVVGGLMVGVAATAWAVVSYEHAANLRDQTALFREELKARVAASEQGRQLQPQTVSVPASVPASLPTPGLPSPPSPSPTSSSAAGRWLVAGLGLASAAALLPLLLRRS